MSSVIEAYYAATERDVVAPSGITYRVRGVSVGEYGAALKGMPILAGAKKSEPGETKPSEVESYLTFQNDLCRAGTIGMAFNGVSGDIDPPEKWPAGDVAAVFLAIQEASGLVGEKADQARRSV